VYRKRVTSAVSTTLHS